VCGILDGVGYVLNGILGILCVVRHFSSRLVKWRMAKRRFNSPF
jgi:hypothetical protein